MSRVLGDQKPMSTLLTKMRPTLPLGSTVITASGPVSAFESPTLLPRAEEDARVRSDEAVSAVGEEVALRVEGLTRSFGKELAVAGISFEARRGEVLGLLGPNGAGKSTTLRLLCGLLTPDRGRIQIGREVVDPQRPSARKILGFVPQDIALYAELSAEENLRFFGKLYGLHGVALRERTEYGLELSGLQDRRAQRVRTFSGGMQRRLNLSCAVLHSPRILLLDEPTVGVDPHSRNHLFTALQELKREGLTLIYSTHHMDDAERLCDRVAIFDAGRILQLDRPQALIQAHAALDLEGVFLDLTGRRLRD